MSKIGRNDPCPCGSGKKYKKCCLDKDEAARRAQPGQPTEESRKPTFISDSMIAQSALSVENRQYTKILKRLEEWVYSEENHQELQRAMNHFSFKGLEQWEHELAGEVINTWLFFVFKTRKGRTFAETFLKMFWHEFSPAEKKILSGLSNEQFRFVEVQDVRLEEGLTLKDMFSNDVFDVRERLATRQLNKWDILLIRLRVLDDHLELDSIMPVNRFTRHVVFDEIDDILDGQRIDDPDADHRDVMVNHFPEVLEAVLEGHRLAMTPPALATTDGEEMVFCKARYQVADMTVVQEALSRHRSFQLEDDDSFTWLSGKRRKGAMAPGRISFGRITIEKTVLILETQSRERLEKGKALLEKIAGAHLKHLADSVEDPMQALANRDVPETPPESSIPPEVERELITQYMEEHYRKWPDTPLPGLDGMTPREASKDSIMRPALIEMMKDMENQSANSHMPAYDFSRIKKELGIDED